MTLRIVQVPDPAPGADFASVVPGRYLYNVTGVTAVLDTGGGGSSTLCFDVSGNGRSGTYQTILSAPPFVAGLLPAGGELALRTSKATFPWTPQTYVTTPDVPDMGAPWSLECWAQVDAPIPAGQVYLFTAAKNPGALDQRVIVETGAGQLEVNESAGNAWGVTTSAMSDHGPHHLVFTYDGAAVHIFVDGAELTLDYTGTPFANGAMSMSALGAFFGGASFLGILDEAAWYDYALDAAQVAAHYAAGAVSFSAYTATVLGDAPWFYYHLDAVGGGGRQVILVVAAAESVVEMIPTGFAVPTSDGPFAYSWQPNVSSSSQATGGITTTVAIPSLILPAGYSVASYTPDLQPTDQWSNVTIWWDDDVMNAMNGANAYAFPGGAKLRYHQEGVPV